MMRLYEFSSSVIAQYNPTLRVYEFNRYEVGQFMNNSFTNNVQTNYRGIPEVIDRAIRNDYFTVKTPSYPHLAWTGRYLEDDWVVLVVSDQLAGRPNELYRYFCVQSPLTEKVDPMLSLLNWYLAQSSPPRFEPEPNPNISFIDIPESPPFVDVNQLNERERTVLNKLQEGESEEFPKINLGLQEVVNIIAGLPLAERITFSWAIGAYNFNSLVRSGKFRLVQSSDGNLWIGPPTVATTINMRLHTPDNEKAKYILRQLASSPESPDFNRLLTALFKQEVDEENWKRIFDNDIGLTALLNINYPDLPDLHLLILQAILIPERIGKIFIFLSRQSGKEHKKIFEKDKKLLFKFEQRVRASLIYQLVEQVYQGVWISLESILETDDHSLISIVEGFLQHESNWLKRNLLSRYKRTNKGLWEFALISKVRFDFYNHIQQIYPPSEPANSFFEKFNSRKDQKSLDFFKRLWHNDPVITTWLYQQSGEKIPHNTFKTIEHLGYSHQDETVLLKDFFFP